MTDLRTDTLATRLDRLPFGRFQRRVLCAMAIAFASELADIFSFSYAAPGLRAYEGYTMHTVAVGTSATFVGMFCGAALGGQIGDRFGRRRSLTWSMAWYSAFSLLNAVVPTVPGLLAARLLTGAGLSAMTVIAVTYIAETMPKDIRGRVQSAALGLGLLGVPVIAFAARLLVPLGPYGWRLVFVIGSLGVLTLPLVLRLPESPRWLLAHRGAAEAERALEHIERDSTGGTPLPPPSTGAPEDTAGPGGRVAGLFSGGLARRTIMLWVAWIFQTLGFYGFSSWVPTLLQAHGHTLTESLNFAAVTTLGAVPGALLAWPITDRLGRRGPIAVTSVVIATCGVLYGTSGSTAAILVFGLLVAMFGQTFVAFIYAYTPEQYPTRLRNTGSGFAYGVGRLANVAGPLIVSGIFAALGYVWVFAYVAACWIVVALAVGLFGPRSNRRSLEELQN